MTGIIDTAKSMLGGGKGDEGQGSGKSALQENAEKALRMKKEAGPQTNIPEHRTSHEGGVGAGQVGATDMAVEGDAKGTPNLKRSGVPRNGDG